MILLSSLAILGVVVLAVLAWMRNGRRWRIGVVECFRVALVSIAVWISASVGGIPLMKNSMKAALKISFRPFNRMLARSRQRNCSGLRGS